MLFCKYYNISGDIILFKELYKIKYDVEFFYKDFKIIKIMILNIYIINNSSLYNGVKKFSIDNKYEDK